MRLVLVVDDDPSLRDLVAGALRASRHDVRTCPDALAAAALLGRLDRVPDLLICDVAMPNVDGFTFVRSLRRRPELEGMAIIFLTARGRVEDVARGINLGAKAYIQKPFGLQKLIETVERSFK